MKSVCYLLVFVACGCNSFRDQASYPDVDDRSPLLFDTVLIQDLKLASRASVKSFYRSRDFSLFWSTPNTYKPAADSLLRIILTVGQHGLIPHDYHAPEIQEILNDSTPAGRLKTDVLFTDAFLTIHQHLRKGRLHPRSLQRIDFSVNSDADAILSLEKVHTSGVAAGLNPAEPRAKQYHLLKQALRYYQFAGTEDSAGQVLAQTIALNMERWRWQQPLPERYIAVNIPAFTLSVSEGDSLWLQTPVIVGKRATPTPVLESVIRSFTIYPYWHVPHGIATKEILPALKADASYLVRNNFDVLSSAGRVVQADTIQWKLYSADRFPFILRQREGTENSMGIIKFNFPNNYNVYLHDTNAKRLFGYKARDFSHGCVRVKDAVSLAHYLVREDDIYVSPEDLDQYLSLQQRLSIELRKPITVKLQYFTAEVKNGNTLFYDDVYRKDSVMRQALYQWPPAPMPVSPKPLF